MKLFLFLFCVISSFKIAYFQSVLLPPEIAVNVKEFVLLLVTSDVEANCSIAQANTAGQVSTLNQTQSCSSFTNIVTNTTNWSLEPNPIMISANGYGRVAVALQAPITTKIEELLVITCCTTNQITSTSSLVRVSLSPDISFNTSVASANTLFPNPAFVNIAPCQCNLTEAACDADCCCDIECSPDELATFSCIPGTFGGDFTVDDPKVCGTQQFDLPDWHQFTCVQFLNSPLLGSYFANVTLSLINANDNATFNQRLAQNPPVYYAFQGEIATMILPTSGSYVNNEPILTLTNNIYDYLVLPQRSLSGQCARNAYILFQNNTDADCDVTVTQEACTTGTILDINYYVTSLTSVVSNSGNIIPTVVYNCDDASNYVKPSTSTSPAPTSSLFNNGATTTASSTPCSDAQPRVSFSSITDICSNAVVNVTYIMTWNGSDVIAVNASITVANISLTSVTSGVISNADITQSFRTRFVPFNAVDSVTRTSGNPGYERGYPVISGANSTLPLGVWQPGSTGLCNGSDSIAPTFGQDLFSGCVVRLQLSDFSNCTSLRQLVEAQQLSLVGDGTLVSRYGNPDFNNTAVDWIAVETSGLTSVNVTLAMVPGQCTDIPAHVRVEFVTSLTGRLYNHPIREIIGARASWIRETWKLSCSGSGACTSGSSSVESFSVTTSVTFTSVDAVPQPPLTLAQLTDTTSCDMDSTCWPELLLPLTEVFYVTMPTSVMRSEREINLLWSLFLLFISLGAALLPLNWRKIGRYIKHTFPL